MVKILSNFDTNLMRKMVEEYSEIYGKDKILYVRRDYIFFILKVISPWTVWLVMTGLFLYLMYIVLEGRTELIAVVRWIGWGMIIIFFLYCLSVSVRGLMDYYLDFTIITPRQITTYDQSGFFSRSTRSLDIEKLKTIRIDKKGLIRSIFNFGGIVFLSEGDRQDFGDITLDYISDPDELRDQIAEIITKGIE